MQSVSRSPEKRRTLAKALMVLAGVIALASVSLLVYSLLPLATPKDAVHTTGTNAQDRAVDTAVHTVAQRYMQALLDGDYHTMWQLLHPQEQALWPGEEAFATFWRTRFQDYTLQGFTPGQVKARRFWVNPETMGRYENVEELPISLQLVPKQPSTQLPPEDLHPAQLFQSLPFIIQQVASEPGGQAKQWRVLAGGPADLEAPILPPAISARQSVSVPILMYHHISDTPARDVLTKSLTVTTTLFRQQLDYLKIQGYTTITFNQLFDALYYGSPLPTRPIILTFDDGYDDAYNAAYPILQAHHYSGMFYIITGKVGWQGQMTWPQMRAMLANGMQMGSHTIHHVDMGAVYLNSPMQAQQEVQVSQQELQKQLGIAIQQFCYPSGEPFRHGSIALQQRVVALLANSGYVGATTDPGLTGVEQTSQAPLALLRIRVDGRESLLGFENSL